MDNLQRITMNPTHYIIGEIKEGFVHVYDVVDHEQSLRAIIDEAPSFEPIPLSTLVELGGTIEPY